MTHTHSAPEVGPPGLPEIFLGDRYEHNFDTTYRDFVQHQLMDGIAEAFLQLRPAALGVGWAPPRLILIDVAAISMVTHGWV